MKRVLIVLAILALALPAAAQTPDPNQGPGPAEQIVVHFLQLTPEQVDAWHGVAMARQEAAAPLQDAIADVQAQLDALFAEEEPDATEVGELVLERRDLGGQLAEVDRTYVEAFEALLEETQMDRLSLVRGAAAVEDVIPAFQKVGLVRAH